MPDFSLLALRDYLLLAAGLVAIYLTLLVIRLRRPPGADARTMAASPLPSDSESLYGPAESPMGAATESMDTAFSRQLAQSSVGLEVQRLQRETKQLRAELAELAEEVRQLKATHNVSPIYSEAMSLAERGELPSGIAARCGISIGEAELVAALARREFGAAVASELDDRHNEQGR